jgi:signal peptidase I
VSQRPAYGWIKEVVQTLGLTLLIFFGIQTFVAQPYRVEQQSMEQTLLQDQYVLVDKLTPRFDTYKRGDIVVFKPPPDWSQQDGTPFIKRVIGVSGDEIEILDGEVLVNGVRLSEPYVYQVDGEPQATETTTEPPRWLVPDGELFVMGDHRSSSSDSRTFGPIGVGDVVGRAWLRYWPADTIGILETPVHPELQSASP